GGQPRRSTDWTCVHRLPWLDQYQLVRARPGPAALALGLLAVHRLAARADHPSLFEQIRSVMATSRALTFMCCGCQFIGDERSAKGFEPGVVRRQVGPGWTWWGCGHRQS